MMPPKLVAEDRSNDNESDKHNKMRSMRSTTASPDSSRAMLFTTWGDYSTEEAVRASRYYTAIILPQSGNHNALLLHAAHPIPSRYLRTLAPEQLESLKLQLTEETNYGTEMRDRVSYTVDAIEEMLGDEDFLDEQMRKSLHNWFMQ